MVVVIVVVAVARLKMEAKMECKMGCKMEFNQDEIGLRWKMEARWKPR